MKLATLILVCLLVLPSCIGTKTPSEAVLGVRSPDYDAGYAHGLWDGINMPFVKR